MSSYLPGQLSAIRKLKSVQDKNAALSPDWIQYEFSMRPSCPPDKRVHIAGGVARPAFQWPIIMLDDFLPAHTCDFEDETDTQLALSFINANWYLPVLLCYFGDWVAFRTFSDAYDSVAFDNVVGTEVATAAEAEQQIDGFLNGVGQWYNYRLPLGGVILKNNGQTEVNYAILPVDLVNRGRSYLYRDARARRGAMP